MLTAQEIGVLVGPYLAGPDAGLCERLAVYLELILKWNARTNLTAIREAEEIVRRHFGESLFAGTRLSGIVADGGTVLDFGSGAGFPGVPMQLLRPEVRVTLAESQGKKAAFLREVARALGLETEVWAGRVEGMAAGRQFDLVAMRAVDKMEVAVGEAVARAKGGVLVLGTGVAGGYPLLEREFEVVEVVRMPESRDGVVWVGRRKGMFHVEHSGKVREG